MLKVHKKGTTPPSSAQCFYRTMSWGTQKWIWLVGELSPYEVLFWKYVFLPSKIRKSEDFFRFLAMSKRSQNTPIWLKIEIYLNYRSNCMLNIVLHQNRILQCPPASPMWCGGCVRGCGVCGGCEGVPTLPLCLPKPLAWTPIHFKIYLPLKIFSCCK